MTFAEKLVRLRKREGLSQEALAEALGVSRQAVSRWEQGTALPDAAKLLPCARYFSVSVDWLLDDEKAWEELTDSGERPAGEAPLARGGNWRWYLAGGIVTGVGVLGMAVMGILSSLFPVVLEEAPVGVEWVHVYTGLIAFLKGNHVEWLFALWAAITLAGLWLLAQPALRRKGRSVVGISPWYMAGAAAGAYGCGQAAWWVQQGKTNDLPLMAFFLAAAIYCVVRLLLKVREESAERRRLGNVMILLYAAAQGIIVLLTAEAGIGIVGLVLHVGVYLICMEALKRRIA